VSGASRAAGLIPSSRTIWAERAPGIATTSPGAPSWKACTTRVGGMSGMKSCRRIRVSVLTVAEVLERGPGGDLAHQLIGPRRQRIAQGRDAPGGGDLLLDLGQRRNGGRHDLIEAQREKPPSDRSNTSGKSRSDRAGGVAEGVICRDLRPRRWR
jgi:hypothetical protein